MIKDITLKSDNLIIVNFFNEIMHGDSQSKPN